MPIIKFIIVCILACSSVYLLEDVIGIKGIIGIALMILALKVVKYINP